MRAGGFFFLTLLVTACGPMTNAGTSGFHQTLEYIRNHGLPSLSKLIPALPSQFASASGVRTDASGKPEIPAGNVSLGFGADIDELAAEARQLSVQGFSEARRIEASIQNFAGPVYDMLGRAELFTQLAGISPEDAQLLAQSQGESELSAASQIFDQLFTQSAFAIYTGGIEGMPSYLMLGTSLDETAVEISGLFAKPNGKFSTGFKSSLKFDETDGLQIELMFQPGVLSGLIPGWKQGVCDGDAWKITAAVPGLETSGAAQLAVSSIECPDQRNAISTLQFGQTESGNWQFGAAFAQTFADAPADSLRGWLGNRQGFVIQATASPQLEKLSAAAAVLPEDSFSGVTQDQIETFGIGSLLVEFFRAKYWQPKRDSARSGNIFTNYDNLSYWTCDAAIVSSSIQNEAAAARQLCQGQTIDIEDGLKLLASTKKNIASQSLVPAEVKATVNLLIDLLTVRNSVFLGAKSSVSYKTAPDSEFSALDDDRKANAPVVNSIASTEWLGSVQAAMREMESDEIPDTAFKAISSSLQSFVRAECLDLSAESANKAGKDPEAAKSNCQ
jgi:hypothetical protein